MDEQERPDPHEDTCTTSAKCKVTTLVNWKQLANVPDSPGVNINGLVQGVHWCEYIVFLDNRNRIYLYHLKWGIWSSMNSMNLGTAANGHPLAVFRNELVIVTSDGNYVELHNFSMDTGHWMSDTKLSTNFSLGDAAWGVKVTFHNVILAATSDQQSLFLLLHQSEDHRIEHYLKEYLDSRWSKAKQLQSVFLGTNECRISYGIVKTDIYIYTGIDKIHIVHTQLKEGERVKVTNVNLPQSLTMSTICGVNDTIFSFGGRDRDNQPSSDVSRYNAATKKWEPAGYMRSCRFSAIVSPFIRDSKDGIEVFIVGGYLGGTTTPNTLLTCRIAESCKVGTSDH